MKNYTIVNPIIKGSIDTMYMAKEPLGAAISAYKTIFTKGYLPSYTEELFKIKQVIYTKPFVYKLEDLQAEEIDGYFYEQELSFVPNPEDIEYKIEKVIKKKTLKGKKLALVKWKGYSDKFNEWIPLEDITRKFP